MTLTAAGNALVDRRVASSQAMRLCSYALLAAGGALLIALAAKIQVPFWPVPVTLQTLAIFVLAAVYGARLAVATVLVYLLQGLAGLPVFAGAVAGPAYFTGPTAGFLAGFVVAAGVTGFAGDRGWGRNPFRLFAMMVVGDIFLFMLGFVWLAFFFVSPTAGSTLGGQAAFAAGVQPFVLADLVKIAFASAIVPALWELFRRKAG